MALGGRTIIPYGFPPSGSSVRRNPGSPHRGFFVSAALASHHHIRIVAAATRTDEPLTPIGNGSVGAESSRRFDGIGLHLMLAIPTPYDKANIGSCSIPEGHRCTGMGFHRLRRRKADRAIIDHDGDTTRSLVNVALGHERL